MQRDLQRILGLSKSWLSEVLSNMEKRGLIVRKRGHGRSLVIMLPRYTDPSIGKTIVFGIVPSVEYLPLSLMLKKLEDQGYKVEISVRRSVAEIAVGLIRGEFHAAYLPIYSYATLRFLGIDIRSLGPVALGGASIIGSNRSGEGYVYSSMFSTMEVLAIAYLRSHGFRGFHSIRYYRDPEEAIKTVSMNGSSVAIVWEPFSHIAEMRGLRRTPLSDIVGQYHCCILAARGGINDTVLSTIRRAHIESIEELGRKIELASEIFSKIIGVDRDIIKKTSKEYIYTYQIDKSLIRDIARASTGFLINTEILEKVVNDEKEIETRQL